MGVAVAADGHVAAAVDAVRVVDVARGAFTAVCTLIVVGAAFAHWASVLLFALAGAVGEVADDGDGSVVAAG